jgi:hypothetical protein
MNWFRLVRLGYDDAAENRPNPHLRFRTSRDYSQNEGNNVRPDVVERKGSYATFKVGARLCINLWGLP